MNVPLRFLLLAPAFFCATAFAVYDGPGSPSPLDSAHLVVVRPSEFSDNKKKPALTKIKDSVFEMGAVPVKGALTAPVNVRFPGRYTLWVRIGIITGGQLPVNVALASKDQALLKTTIGHTAGAAGQGGPAGFSAYHALAAKGGVFKDVSVQPDAKPAGKVAAKGDDDLDKELRALSSEISGGNTGEDWATGDRLEVPQKARPFYWWKAGTLDLAPGEHQLSIVAPSDLPADSVLLDAAFLTTNEKLLYPFMGDINAPRASYVRFRIDQLPKAGVLLSAAFKMHYDPFGTARVSLNPAHLSPLKSEPHTKTGFTRWYRLQDIERSPAFGAAEATLMLGVAPVVTTDKVKVTPAGATQFAVLPHQDQVLREFNWDEPEGLHLSLSTDFETHLHKLRTLRDHAREHYDMALRSTDGKIFPLTRGDLYFGNGWGASTGECTDYMNKTLRLLGMNSVSASDEPVKYRQLYGWTSQGGHYWPPSFLPLDEAAARQKYDAHYKTFFTPQKEFYAGTTTFQIADEPGEISRGEMSAPLWRFEKDERGGKWEDAVGGSDLHTRRSDYHDCVLEGKIEQHARSIGFRVAIDDALSPQNFASWHVGAVSQSREQNLSIGRTVKGVNTHSEMTRAGASVAATGTPFKIVYHGTSAALLLNGKMIQQQDNLPARGGFGFTGPPKAIRELRIRPMQKGEQLSALDAAAEKQKGDLADLGLDDSAGKAGEALAKPLEQFIKEDWSPAGGMAEAHFSFRKWAAAQGVQPALFGVKSWDEVRPLTVASLVRSPEEARLYYWSRKFSGWLTSRMFNMAAEAIHQYAPNPQMRGYVALSGHSLYFPSEQPLDTFQLAAGSAMTPGISDWMSLGSWFWDSHQAVAFSIAPYNAGARRYGQEPLNHPMMHCVTPSTLRAYTMLANNARVISYWNFGPSYAVTEGFWSESEGAYRQAHLINNRAAQVDDVLAHSQMRPCRVAMLYSMSNEYWNAQSSFADKRAAFLGLSHEYYQPELVTEEQIAGGALKHYDALYILDPAVATAAQEKAVEWAKAGGLLWVCADALSRNEFNEPADILKSVTGVQRKLPESNIFKPVKAASPVEASPVISPVSGEADFRSYSVASTSLARVAEPGPAKVRARYDDGSAAWLEAALGKGKVVFIAHRCGLTYTQKKFRVSGYHPIWTDSGREPLTLPLHEAKVEREVVLSDPVVMASPMSSSDATVILLHNMQPTPRRNLNVSLREPSAPASVAIFSGSQLVPLPFEFRDGRVSMTLPELAAEQMILVRRKAAPEDPRLAEMRTRTEAQLKSTDAAALSAGAWFAGFLTERSVAAKLTPLLKHDRWEVRRAATESLGRVGDGASANALFDAFQKEKDSHVRGDALVALAHLKHPMVERLCEESLAHRDAFVRRQALMAAAHLAEDKSAMKHQLAERGFKDPDQRVRHAALELLTRTDAAKTVERIVASFEPASTLSPAERTEWAQAIADSDTVFAEYLKQQQPGGTALLLTIAARRSAPALVQALAAHLARLDAADAVPFATAALQQKDKSLARKLLEIRKSLPPALAAYLPMILEHAFEARLGDAWSSWEALLARS